MARLKPHFSSLFFFLSLFLCASLSAQTVPSAVQSLKPIAQQNRVPASSNFGPQAQLQTKLPNWANADRKIAGQPVDLTSTVGISVVLQRDPAVQAAFEQMLTDQQTPSSPMFHQWLTPQQVGDLYGPTKDDIAAVTVWLAAQGLAVTSVAPSGMIIDATGTAESVGNAFRVSFANFTVGETVRRGIMTQPSIPAVLAAVISDVNGLNEVIAEPQSHGVPMKAPQPSQDGLQPEFTNGSNHYIAPKDFQTIYDLTSVISGGNTGATIGNVAQHIAIIGRSHIVATDISEFVTNTALASENLNTIIPTTGVDPGTPGNGDTLEATIDVGRVIGTANGAQADLVVSGTAGGFDGIYVAASYNVNTLVDPVMTISFGACEHNAGSSGVTLWDTLFSSAAAEGISSFVSSDDSGAAGCDTQNANAPSTTQILSPNYICASSYVTCVGGTEFADTASPSTYWNTSNGTDKSSAKIYIPEGAWNEPGTASPFQVAATGGGVSGFIAKPSWQTGTGVPADGFRDTPDIAFSASAHDGYYACYASGGGDCATNHFEFFDGTSAAAPGMAGITALLNTKMGVAQGNLNPMIYALAASHPSSFHDVTPTSSGVVSCSTATPSMCNNSTPTLNSLTGGLAGYAVTTGYDQATGWGSLDVANFLTAASTPGATTQTITFPQPAAGQLNGTVTLTATSNSGLGIIYTIASGSATIAGSKVTYNAAGSVVINATQPGNYQYAAATTVQKTVVVVAPPVIIKSFGAASIAVGGSTSLTFTIQNNNASNSLSGIGFTDSMPAGLVVATPNGLVGSCGGGTITAVAGSTSVSMSGSTIAATAQCQFSVNVTGTSAGTKNNTTGNVISTEGGTGGTASASLSVVTPNSPVIIKSFGVASIFVNGTTSLTFTIQNNNASANLSGIAFTDNFPAGLVVSTPNGLTGSCGGGTITAVAGSGSVSLSGSTIGASAQCQFSVNVKGTTSGIKNNTTGNVTATESGVGGTASASVSVVTPNPPVIIKAFGAASIAVGGSTSLTFTIQNNNASATLSGIAFTDNFPAGLVVATPNGLTGSCGGGTITAVAGSTSVSLSGSTISATAQCQFSVNVTGATSGTKNNTTGNVTATESGAGGTASASVTVVTVNPPVIIKAFGIASVSVNGSTSLTFTIQNNNTLSGLSGIGFTDTFPAGLVVSTPNGLTGSCGGGTITAVAGTTSVSMSGSTIGASGSCTFSVNVKGITAGQKNNTTGNVTSTEGGTGGTASASLSVTPDVFVILSGGKTASFHDDGSVLSSATLGGGIGAAVDANGLVWSINPSGTTVSNFTDAGVAANGYSGAGMTGAKALAIDGNNITWIANGNGTVTALTNAGVGVFTTPIDPGGSASAPGSISVDTAGSLWISTPSTNSITEVIGAAGPVSTPTVTQVINSTPGTKP